jgi:queuine/archaeosine tRNA-ribosyltransferase
MSVSSHETQFEPAIALRALKVHNTSSILVSAYDLVKSHDREEMIKEIKSYRENGGFVLMDSGNYEATRLNDKDWTPTHFKQALAEGLHDWAFIFDTKPSKDPQTAIRNIVKAVARDSKRSSTTVLPIVHVKQNDEGLAQLPEIVRGVSEQLGPPLIAIAERELGAGMAARAKTMKRIRTELNKLPYYQAIHLLGTGNPWSIAVLVAAGADTFDGLEWCRFAIDPVQGRLHHFQHFDFFKNKGERTPFLDMVDDDDEIEYAGRVAFYNLEYYAEFGRTMRGLISTKDTELFATGTMWGIGFQELRKLFPEIFP